MLPSSLPNKRSTDLNRNNTLGRFSRHKRKRRAFAGASALLGKEFPLEHEPQTQARAERLLEEIVVHSIGCERELEVLVVDAKALVGVLVDQSFGLSVGDVEGIKTELQADAVVELPWIFQVSVNTGRRGRTAKVSAAKQRDFTCVLIGLLSDQGG